MEMLDVGTWPPQHWRKVQRNHGQRSIQLTVADDVAAWMKLRSFKRKMWIQCAKIST